MNEFFCARPATTRISSPGTGLHRMGAVVNDVLGTDPDAGVPAREDLAHVLGLLEEGDVVRRDP